MASSDSDHDVSVLPERKSRVIWKVDLPSLLNLIFQYKRGNTVSFDDVRNAIIDYVTNEPKPISKVVRGVTERNLMYALITEFPKVMIKPNERVIRNLAIETRHLVNDVSVKRNFYATSDKTQKRRSRNLSFTEDPDLGLKSQGQWLTPFSDNVSTAGSDCTDVAFNRNLDIADLFGEEKIDRWFSDVPPDPNYVTSWLSLSSAAPSTILDVNDSQSQSVNGEIEEECVSVKNSKYLNTRMHLDLLARSPNSTEHSHDDLTSTEGSCFSPAETPDIVVTDESIGQNLDYELKSGRPLEPTLNGNKSKRDVNRKEPSSSQSDGRNMAEIAQKSRNKKSQLTDQNPDSKSGANSTEMIETDAKKAEEAKLPKTRKESTSNVNKLSSKMSVFSDKSEETAPKVKYNFKINKQRKESTVEQPNDSANKGAHKITSSTTTTTMTKTGSVSNNIGHSATKPDIEISESSKLTQNAHSSSNQGRRPDQNNILKNSYSNDSNDKTVTEKDDSVKNIDDPSSENSEPPKVLSTRELRKLSALKLRQKGTDIEANKDKKSDQLTGEHGTKKEPLNQEEKKKEPSAERNSKDKRRNSRDMKNSKRDNESTEKIAKTDNKVNSKSDQIPNENKSIPDANKPSNECDARKAARERFEQNRVERKRQRDQKQQQQQQQQPSDGLEKTSDARNDSTEEGNPMRRDRQQEKAVRETMWKDSKAEEEERRIKKEREERRRRQEEEDEEYFQEQRRKRQEQERKVAEKKKKDMQNMIVAFIIGGIVLVAIILQSMDK